MAWDFSTEPEFQKKLDWVERFCREQVEPLDLVFPYAVRSKDPKLKALVKDLQDQVKEQGLWALFLDEDLGGPGFGQLKLGLLNEILGRYGSAPQIFGAGAPDTGNMEMLAAYGTDDQKERWLTPMLNQELWSAYSMTEPQGGSDPNLFTTHAVKDGDEWVINGQKVWTSGAHYSGMGFATVRTNPDAAKHDGITMMVIDMHAEGVEVRPLKMVNGGKEFNEVFFSDVFVPDDDVVGPVDGGWTVARATLGNESVSIGSGDGGMAMPPELLLSAFDEHPDRLAGGAARVGRYIAEHHSMGLMNLRAANRAVAGADPGVGGAITKLVLSEIGHDAASILTECYGPDSVFMDGMGAISNPMVLMHRALSIAGGTSEIKRNQIGERILGMPRDPLIN